MADIKQTYDVVILTEQQYVNPTTKDEYIENVLLEDRLVIEALEKEGLKVLKTNWDNPNILWSSVKIIVLRSIWDYHHRIEAFNQWLASVENECLLINSIEIIQWNIDKHYLRDMHDRGIRIVPTAYVEKGDTSSLSTIVSENGWKDIVLKPCISAAAKDTYKIPFAQIASHEISFKEHLAQEAMMVQPFIKSIETKGELSMMVFGGKYSHTVLKKAKPGDFRVQDDFGGSVHTYEANKQEVAFAESVVNACPHHPMYARVDAVWNDNDELCLSELELIEPELWFRERPEAATEFAKLIGDVCATNFS